MPMAMGQFDGVTFSQALDGSRLTSQLARVWAVMARGEWMTLSEIANEIGARETGVSARLRDFRKERFGRHNIISQPTNVRGVWVYKMVLKDELNGEPS